MCVLSFSTTFVWNISHSKKKWARLKRKYIGVHVTYPLFLSDFNETWIFCTEFRKTLKYQIQWKSVQWELSCSMRTDWRTDMKLIVVFRNFANAPKNLKIRTWTYLLLYNKCPYIAERTNPFQDTCYTFSDVHRTVRRISWFCNQRLSKKLSLN